MHIDGPGYFIFRQVFRVESDEAQFLPQRPEGDALGFEVAFSLLEHFVTAGFVGFEVFLAGVFLPVLTPVLTVQSGNLVGAK